MASTQVEDFDYIIVGGGIVGAGIFRDLSLHDQKTLLIERGQFCSQTSARSSKMLHGGIRYLENFDFGLVKEALAEKNFWVKHSPDLIKEKMFLVPVYKTSKWALPFMIIGVFLYDLLSLFKNPRFNFYFKRSTLKKFPGLNKHGLRGSVAYSDAIMDDRELGVMCINDSQSEKAQALENCEFKSCAYIDSKWHVQYEKNGEILKVKCNHLIFALGPFTDIVLNKTFDDWESILLPSKGVHLWLSKDSLKLDHPMVLQTRDNRVIFVIPHETRILVGTTETQTNEEFFNIEATDQEVSYLLECVNEYFPEQNITHKHIESSFAGIRPLVAEPGKSRNKVSRKHFINEFKPNCHVIAGGKYTTFRVMASELVKKTFKKEGKAYNDKLSLKKFK